MFNRFQKSFRKRRHKAMIAREGGKLQVQELPGGMLYLGDMRHNIDQTVFMTGAWEPETTKVMESLVKPGQVAFDVGANTGYYTVTLSRLTGPEGRVVAFEPMKEAYWRMVALHALNVGHFCYDNLTTVPMALSDMEGVDQTRFEFAFDTAADAPEAPVREIRFTTLDLYVAKTGLEQLDFLKVDVDGFEEAFLKGADSSLARFRPSLIMEYAALPGIGAVHQWLLDHDFQITRLDTGAALNHAGDVAELEAAIASDQPWYRIPNYNVLAKPKERA